MHLAQVGTNNILWRLVLCEFGSRDVMDLFSENVLGNVPELVLRR